tara:strand:+ start:1014 stop:1220 length:207 start_codon:yes stop_codon:yes gene_type:complete
MFDDFDCGEYYEGEDYNVWEENQVFQDLYIESLEETDEIVDDPYYDEDYLDGYVEEEISRIRRNFLER